VCRALNSQDAETVARGEGIAAKNPEGEWVACRASCEGFVAHVVGK